MDKAEKSCQLYKLRKRKELAEEELKLAGILSILILSPLDHYSRLMLNELFIFPKYII